MEQEPLIAFKGGNGKIELYKNFVRFDRWTIMGTLQQGLKGKKDIYFPSITSIQIKKPGLVAGYMQFSIGGGNESQKGAWSSIKDENSISFQTSEKYEKALKIKEYIENQKKASSATLASAADEIEKLYSLIEKGILTQEEFEAKKRGLLE